MVDLSPLTCRTPECPGRLEPTGGGRVRCMDCGQDQHGHDLIKPYARTTGQWFIGAAAAFAWGFGQAQGQARWIALAAAGALLAYAASRVWTQRRLLKSLSENP